MQLQGTEHYGNIHVSFSGSGRLHLGNRYIYVSMHHYCGPDFFYDRDMTKPYKFTDECVDDPIWPLFNEWNKKYNKLAKKAGKWWARDDNED